METKHTQGEWTFSPMKGKQGHCFVAQVWDTEGNNLATVDSRYGEEEATANAKLIASAPDLLEALYAVLRQVNGHEHIFLAKDGKVIQEIKNAIKKATE